MPLSFGCQPIQQNTILAIMNAITQHHIETDDISGLDAALEHHTRRLKSLRTYEQRRRRAAKETLAEFNKVEQEHHDAQQEHLQAAAETHQAFKKLGQSWDPKDWPSNKRAF
jgi:cell division FtsZ-interacting protein ZapD